MPWGRCLPLEGQVRDVDGGEQARMLQKPMHYAAVGRCIPGMHWGSRRASQADHILSVPTSPLQLSSCKTLVGYGPQALNSCVGRGVSRGRPAIRRTGSGGASMRAPSTRPCAGSIAGPFAAVFPRQSHSAHRQRAAPQRQLTRTSVAALENPATQLPSSLSNGAAEPLEFDEVDSLFHLSTQCLPCSPPVASRRPASSAVAHVA